MPLDIVKLQPNKEAVSALEEMLEMAKTGEIQGFTAISFGGRSAYTHCAGKWSAERALYALASWVKDFI